MGAAVAGILLMMALTTVPPTWRKVIVALVTFLSGAVYVAYFLWPTAQEPRGPHDVPQGLSESVAFWLSDAVPIAGNVANSLTIFLLGLGIYSLMRIHTKRLVSMHKDWFFSAVVIFSMLLMVTVGYWNYYLTNFTPQAGSLADPANWTAWNKFYDFLFDGLYQTMDAGMFSIIAFYILSAAYRAFRVRSVEATILLAAALLVMLSLMGPFVQLWNGFAGGHGAFTDNFKIDNIAEWIRNSFQEPGIRALEFGVGLGALAMGMRLWLSLEKGGVN
jgi:hypothetical protein